jgi:hypothetical protein
MFVELNADATPNAVVASELPGEVTVDELWYVCPGLMCWGFVVVNVVAFVDRKAKPTASAASSVERLTYLRGP